MNGHVITYQKLKKKKGGNRFEVPLESENGERNPRSNVIKIYDIIDLE